MTPSVAAIFLNEWILPIDGVASERVCVYPVEWLMTASYAVFVIFLSCVQYSRGIFCQSFTLFVIEKSVDR